MLRACAEPGCSERIEDGARCPAHQQVWNRSRGNSTERGYDWRWRRLRAAFLRARCEACTDRPSATCERCRGTGLENAFCRDCARAGQMVEAAEVHHVQSIRLAPERRLDATNLVAVCVAHHHERERLGKEARGIWA
jgi:hypothetical protein